MKFALPTCSRRPVLRRNPRSMKCCDSSHAWADSSLARAMANPARKPSGRDSQPYASPQKQCVCYVTTVVATLATLAYKDMGLSLVQARIMKLGLPSPICLDTFGLFRAIIPFSNEFDSVVMLREPKADNKQC